MTDVLITLIKELNSSVFVLILILILAFWSYGKLMKFIAKWEHRDDDLSRIKDKLDNDIPYMKERINIMFQSYSDSPSAVASKSPLTLTETGKAISEEIKAGEIIQQHFSALSALVKKCKPKHAYDYQKFSVEIVEKELVKMLDHGHLNKAKDQALKYGIPLDNALSVVAVLLRDRLLEESGIHISEVDKNDPNKESKESITKDR